MSDNFTKQQIKALDIQFRKFDANGDAEISTKELGNIMKSLGQPLSQHQLQCLINSIDTDGNGTIEFSQFLSLMGKKMKSLEQEDQLKLLFSQIDIDGDKHISKSDLRMALERWHNQDYTENIELMVSEIMMQIDVDMNGKISYEEFVTIMMAL